MILIISPSLEQRNNKGALAYTLDIPLTGLRMGQDEQQYELQSIIDYIGRGEGGHYITYSRRRESWCCFDDNKARRIDIDTSNPTCPVMLVYTKTGGGAGRRANRIISNNNDRAARYKRKKRENAEGQPERKKQIEAALITVETQKQECTGKRKAPQECETEQYENKIRPKGLKNPSRARKNKPKPTSPHYENEAHKGLVSRLEEGRNLNSEDIDVLLCIIKKTYGAHTLGLDDPMYQDRQNYRRGVAKVDPRELWKARQVYPWSIQVLFLPNHWVVAEHIKGDSVVIYDTLPLESNKPIIMAKCIEIFAERQHYL